MTDWILRGGSVVDGTGAPRFRADVAIAGDRIAAIGDVSKAQGALLRFSPRTSRWSLRIMRRHSRPT